MSARSVYRTLVAIRGCWVLAEWLFGWGAYSYVTTFKWSYPYANLVSEAVAVAFGLAILWGMWFFQRWARWTLVIILAAGLLTSPFRVHRYSLSSPPSFIAPISILMLLLTGAIIAMSFLPPVRGAFEMEKA
jgi:hypothetical protein